MMADKPKMRWSRTDVAEDFDYKLLLLARLRPLTGKGLYTVLRNLIYAQAPAPLYVHDYAHDYVLQKLKVLLPTIPKKTIFDLIDACIECELFEREPYQASGELTSRRIREEIKARFGDMGRAKRHRDSRRDLPCDSDCDSGCDSARTDSARPVARQLTGNSKQITGEKDRLSGK